MKTKNPQSEKIVASMSLEEKLRLLAGHDFWHMEGVPSANLPSIMVTDGPHGLRKQAGESDHLGLNGSVPATCFPPACLMASGWDARATEEEGAAIGEECLAEEVAILLGPGTNIKRSPLCGRNFEYYSEDPYLAGKLAAGFIRGVQSKGVGTSLKHFAANSQEKARLSSNSVVDERALREIYLKSFEIAVKEARPATLMCSYNMINTVYSAENKWLLSDVLRDEWGFEGFVMTDWGAMSDRVNGVKAGLDLEMPGPSPENEEEMRKALEEGRLTMEEVDRCIIRLVDFILSVSKNEKKPYSIDEHHALARRLAASSFVLLENKGALPLEAKESYALIGSFAEKARYQGAGSSKINPTRLDCIKDSLRQAGLSFSYAAGYDHETGETSDEMIKEAIKACEGKKAAITVIGLPDSYESEGFDRAHMNLPEGQIRLIDALLEKGVKVIAIVLAGAPVTLPFRKDVSALLFCYLGGQALGGALCDVLLGKVNPSGKLAETFPLSIEDTPCYGYFATEERNVEYRESIFTGYRYYEKMGKEVAYPFGYGLSYTTFALSDFTVAKENDSVAVTVKVKNTGSVSGSEVVQIYTGMKESRIMRPVKELRAFEKVALEPGEEKTLSFVLDSSAFSYYDTTDGCFEVEEGEYIIYCGTSSANISFTQAVTMEGTKKPHGAKEGDDFASLFGGKIPAIPDKAPLSLNTPVSQILETEAGKTVLQPLMDKLAELYGSRNDDIATMMLAMLMDMPLRGLKIMGLPGFSPTELLKELKEYRK